MTTNKWGALASFLLAISFIVAPLIYLMGNLRDSFGIFSYTVADFLYGPILSASLITVTYILREKISKHSKRMDFALLASILASVGIAAVAFMRASNRQYHVLHPELNLENNQTVLLIWSTIITGLSGLGFHFLGWSYILIGSASWKTKFFPNILNILYFLTGIMALFSYLARDAENSVAMFAAIISIWQGILLWKSNAEDNSSSPIH